MLYPVENEVREVKDLSGIWNFKIGKDNEGISESWFDRKLTDTIPMPVPSSYNDITTDDAIRDHIGDVWYDKTFFVPTSWKDRRIVIRVGSATHRATLWINGKYAVSHEGGFLPFEADITDMVFFEKENRVTIVVNNILDWSCLPSGEILTYEKEGDKYPEGYRIQDTFFDFFNFSGIHRPVKLYTTPKTYIEDITTTTNIKGKDGVVSYKVLLNGDNLPVKAFLYDEDGRLVAEGEGVDAELVVADVRLWEPGNAYLYKLFLKTYRNGNAEDSYELNVGIRTVAVEGDRFLINGKPFYFKGFGKHEDSDIRGKGLDEALNVRDFNLLKWMGANSFRTSHYPYSEELINLADREGMVLIGEVPAVGMCGWSPTNTVFREDRINDNTLKNHLTAIHEMISRDKNHPCMVMWSIANEAATDEEAALPYFKVVAEETRKCDPSRPITIVQVAWPEPDNVGQLVDVLCVNRYYAWYFDPGHIELIERHMTKELVDWHKKYNKPVIMTEFGADTIAGFHQVPPVMFTEEFQCEFLQRYFDTFDKLDFVIGEHVWAFADFATKQAVNRAAGNKKGVFTRQRQPKAAAQLLKERWTGKHPKW